MIRVPSPFFHSLKITSAVHYLICWQSLMTKAVIQNNVQSWHIQHTKKQQLTPSKTSLSWVLMKTLRSNSIQKQLWDLWWCHKDMVTKWSRYSVRAVHVWKSDTMYSCSNQSDQKEALTYHCFKIFLHICSPWANLGLIKFFFIFFSTQLTLSIRIQRRSNHKKVQLCVTLKQLVLKQTRFLHKAEAGLCHF